MREIRQIEFEPLDDKKSLPKETIAGEAFWAWMQEQLAKGGSNINHSGALAHVTEDGILLDADLVFDEFVKSQSQYTDKVVVMRQFNYLGISAKSGSDFKTKKYFGSYDQKQSQGGATLFGHTHHQSHSNRSGQSTINAIVVSPAAVEGAYQFVHSEHVKPTTQASWVSQFFARFMSMLNVSGFDHTQQP